MQWHSRIRHTFLIYTELLKRKKKFLLVFMNILINEWVRIIAKYLSIKWEVVQVFNLIENMPCKEI